MDNDPFEVLGIEHSSDEAAIRRRYLELVRQFPPDRDPERFAAVREAYEKLRDPATRMTECLFHVETGRAIERAADTLIEQLHGARLPTDLLLSLAGR